MRNQFLLKSLGRADGMVKRMSGAVSGAKLPDELHQLRGEGHRLHRPAHHRRAHADLLHA